MYTARWVAGISEIEQAAWDSLAEPLETPLLEWEWLRQWQYFLQPICNMALLRHCLRWMKKPA